MSIKKDSTNFEWCYGIEQTVKGLFYDTVENGELKENDLFIVKDRDVNEDGEQFFKVCCKRTNSYYDIPASLLDII